MPIGLSALNQMKFWGRSHIKTKTENVQFRRGGNKIIFGIYLKPTLANDGEFNGLTPRELDIIC